MPSRVEYILPDQLSKRQECVSHSTLEAEIVAADWALRREGIPMLDLWDILAGKGQKVVFHDDNESMIKICKSGRNPTMRHLLRSHGVAVAWLKEQFDSGNYELRYVPSAHQAADIYTKGFDNAEKWNSVRRLIGLYAPDEVNVSKIIAFWSSVEEAAIPVQKDKESADKGDGSSVAGGHTKSTFEEVTSNSSSFAGGKSSEKKGARLKSAKVRRQSVPIPTAHRFSRQHYGNVASAATGGDYHHTGSIFSRVLLEICCSPSSSLGEVGDREFKDCLTIRKTEEDDFTTNKGQLRVKEVLDKYATRLPVLVWVSLPCTGGSSWQDLNWRKGSESTKEGIRKQWRQLKNMWNALCQIVFPRLDGRYMCMAFEWPAACSYWNWSPDVRDLDGHETPHIREILAGKLRFTSLVHGCEHELVASRGKHKGELVRKLWRIDSDCDILVRALHRDRRMNLHERRCEWRKYPCLHAKGVFHAACAGQVTRDTQLYPSKLAHAVHQAWRSHAQKVSVSPCMCVPSFRRRNRHATGKKDASVAISVPKLERPVRLQYRACWAPEWLVLLPCSACNRVLQCSVYVEMGAPTYREQEQLTLSLIHI